MQEPSSTPKQQRHSIAGSPPNVESGRRRPSFLHLHIPETNWRGSLTHLHLPTFTLTTPEGDQSRKFNFGLGIRRHSHHVSRKRIACSQYIKKTNANGLQNNVVLLCLFRLKLKQYR
ncbi:hypothetical protein Zmor_025494 [Zophobas morio]|uniref:Uncharacterized protein n=1 Tax=Zophobas morio TaxID=2755281 RepID=A0AA38HS94_9CUCU|nr:hypothetical protein Zmor_025494 [Zophobas morio]